ncbi:aminotransferase class I/II-fold pyridoxal phosphate-dependent enzyme [Candidatus Peregrinibacteria bacterium]|nr:aminotransferase class I/II-fold pyridoxal phosphate-dependent enzyme [Candidatus Peregrinibacteria bacterium]
MNAEASTHDLSSSEKAMETFLKEFKAFQNPLERKQIPGMPSLPALKKMAQSMGGESVDMSAGDIGDTGQPMNTNFIKKLDEVRDDLISDGHKGFEPRPGEVHGYPINYQQDYPVVIEAVAKSLGITLPYKAIQTGSGRSLLENILNGWEKLAETNGTNGQKVIVVDPLAWPGLSELADDLRIQTLYMPVSEGHSLGASPEGLKKALAFARKKNISPIGIYTISPSNPSGLTLSPELLAKMIKLAAKHKIPLMQDGFYAPLHPEGHQNAIPMKYLEEKLTPEELQYFGIAIGTTKVIGSNEKTAEAFWMAPKGYEAVATGIIGEATKKKLKRNNYPHPDHALATLALHRYGIHEAMGDRYTAIETQRKAIRDLCDELGLGLTIGDSFYGVAALVKDGKSLIRDNESRPITDPSQAVNTLAKKYGLVGAPGPLFRPENEAAVLLRLTAASTAEKIQKLKEILAQMITNVERYA